MSKDTPSQSSEDLAELARWIEANRAVQPKAVITALTHYLTLASTLSESSAKVRGFLLQLRRALGMTPSSEKRRGSSSTPKRKRRPKTREELVESQGGHDRLSQWHKDQARKHKRKSKKIEDRLKSLDEIELTPEESAANALAVAAYRERLKLGGEADPRFEGVHEPFMEGMPATVVELDDVAEVDRSMLGGAKVIDRTTEERVRFDFALEVKKINIAVEKLVVRGRDGEKTMVSARTTEFGPEGYSVTWGFLAQLCLLVSQYALPMNRIATMLSSPEKKFSSSGISKYFLFVAGRFAGVYLQLFKELAHSDVFSGDDTSVRVLEVTRYFANLRASANQKQSPHAPDPPPWAEYASKEAAAASTTLLTVGREPLGVRLGRQLCFVSSLRAGEGVKTTLHTTVVSGRAAPLDPDSTIVFYRSHFGGFGNLLEELLRLRPEAETKLFVQTDLSRVNVIADEELQRKFDVTYAGCTSHARRPFALHEDDDPDNCAYMLHMFKGIFIQEQGLDLYGRNEINVKAVRGQDSREHWETILDIAKTMAERWPPKSELGIASAYIIRYFDKLTVYLSHPRLNPSNDFSERMLRMEKMIEASALFRNSLEGRFALDIMRTMIQTAIAARVEVKSYLEFVMKADPADVEENPSAYTPRAFSAKHTG